MSFGWFSNFAILENFHLDFSGTMKAQKLIFHINMDNDLIYGVYCNMGQGSITLGVMSLDRFSKFKMHLLTNFYVFFSTSMNLLPHFVFKVRKMY